MNKPQTAVSMGSTIPAAIYHYLGGPQWINQGLLIRNITSHQQICSPSSHVCPLKLLVKLVLDALRPEIRRGNVETLHLRAISTSASCGSPIWQLRICGWMSLDVAGISGIYYTFGFVDVVVFMVMCFCNFKKTWVFHGISMYSTGSQQRAPWLDNRCRQVSSDLTVQWLASQQENSTNS